ncbi:MAG: type I pantothenate kinase [Hyphomicrobiales bacterium]|nr:type I pantothenate kinase [Hyphomicrobiales bacterium]
MLKPAPTLSRPHLEFSPYRVFTREEWAKLREDTPMTLTESDLEQLRGVIERISASEVVDIYLPLSRLINFYVRAALALHGASSKFFSQRGEQKLPFIIGMAGSVAVGKSTSARVLRELLSRWSMHPKVDLVPTDGFLLPNATLEARGLMVRKGFPESYDQQRLLQFMADVKAGRRDVTAPVYSHFNYDITGQTITIDRPDILIVEGLNVLQPAKLPKDGEAIPFVSDFFDFSIYIDADADVIEEWYLTRFMTLWRTAFRDPSAYFHRYAHLSETQAREKALHLWRSINLINLRKNILPTRPRADLILKKGRDHAIERVALRKL